jgi:rhomboid family GlyGly-CTERM serine protease
MIASSAMPVSAQGSIPRAADAGLRAELLGFAFLLVLLNLPLFAGRSTAALAFQADAVAADEWWRFLTHPFVHVSWYHLLLDGAAFLSLYANLHAEKRWQRLTYVSASAAGSLIVALCASPLIATHGLCGLSGAAHGLMAVSSLEMLSLSKADRSTRTVALSGFLAVAAKCVFELASGHALFAGLHFGLLGTPIVACHAGGVLGGVIAALLSQPNGVLCWRSRTGNKDTDTESS